MKVAPPISPPKAASKALEIHGQLVEMATTLGPNAKLPTVQQLRRDLKVSITTLDTVLRELEKRSVIYRKQGSGIFVSPHLNQKCVGLVCAPEFFRPGTSPFWSEIVEDMRLRASLRGEIFRFYLSLPSGRSDVPVHEDLQDDVASRRINGVFFIGNNAEAVSWLESQDMAVVNFAGRATHKVDIDYENLIEQSLDELVKAGCQHIGLMSPFHYRAENTHLHLTKTSRYFQKSLRKRGLAVLPSLIWDANNIKGSENQTYQEQGFEAAFQFFNSTSPQRPDGLVIVDDMMTRGVIVGLQKLELSPGKDIKIASHINRGSAVLQGYEHELILLEINPTEIVQAMFEMLNDLMDGKEVAPPIREMKAHLKH